MSGPLWEREHIIALVRALQEGGDEAAAKAGPPGSGTFEVFSLLRWREGCRASVIVDPRTDLSGSKIRLALRLATPGDAQVRVFPLDKVVNRQDLPAGSRNFLLGRVDGGRYWIENNVASLFLAMFSLKIFPDVPKGRSSKGVSPVADVDISVGARWETDRGGGAHDYGMWLNLKWSDVAPFVCLDSASEQSREG